MFALRDIAVTLAILGSVPFIIVRPHIGILMWSWIAFMAPHQQTWGFASSFPFAMVIALATIIGWFLSREPKKLPMDPITVLMILLTVWFTFTTIVAINPDIAYGKWDRSFKILFMTFLTVILINNQERLNWFIWVVVGSVGFFGIKGGLFTALSGAGRVFGPPNTMFADNNALGLALVMILPLLWYLQSQADRIYIKWGVRGAMVLTALSVIGTYSRGALVGLVAMGLFLVFRSRQRGFLIVALVAGLFIGIPFIPESWIARMETIQNYEEDESAQGRIQAWTFATRLALDRPLTGGGFRVNRDGSLFYSYVPDADKPRAFHSVYFEMLGEHGFIGLAIFLLLAATTFFTGSRIIRLTKNRDDLRWANDLARMSQVALVGYGVSGLFLNLAFFDLYYALIAMMLLTKLFVLQALAQGAEKPPDETAPAAPKSLYWNARMPARPIPRR